MIDINNLLIGSVAYFGKIYQEYDLSFSEIAVFQAICHHYNNNTLKAFPSQEAIAEGLNTYRKTVNVAVNKLRDKKIIEAKQLQGQVNEYVFTKTFLKKLEDIMTDNMKKINENLNQKAKKNSTLVVKKETNLSKNNSPSRVKITHPPELKSLTNKRNKTKENKQKNLNGVSTASEIADSLNKNRHSGFSYENLPIGEKIKLLAEEETIG